MSKKFFVIISLLAIIGIVLCIPHKETVLVSEIETINNGQQVSVTGFMSPVLGSTGNYFYLSDTPYNINVSENCIPVFIKVQDNMKLKYTDKLITVSGEYIYSKKGYKQADGVFYNYRVINAKYVETPKEEYETYSNLASTGIYEDLYMFYGVFKAVNYTENVDIQLINTDEFKNMLILLAVSGEIDDKLGIIINKETEIANTFNTEIENKTYDFSKIASDVEELEDLLKAYFEGYSYEKHCVK